MGMSMPCALHASQSSCPLGTCISWPSTVTVTWSSNTISGLCHGSRGRMVGTTAQAHMRFVFVVKVLDARHDVRGRKIAQRAEASPEHVVRYIEEEREVFLSAASCFDAPDGL